MRLAMAWTPSEDRLGTKSPEHPNGSMDTRLRRVGQIGDGSFPIG
jgi:hypothetical protein